MIVLNKNVAQEIVDKTINIIKFNVNIMDSNGTIIASGDKNRIGNLHEGALITISRNEAVIIDKYLENKLAGTSEGINLPIKFRGEIIGVVGISGECEKVKEYSELVKMSTELYIEQSILIKEQITHSQSKDQFLSALLKNSNSAFNIELAKLYKEKLNLDYYHKVFILEFFDEDFVMLNNKINKVKTILNENVNINFLTLDSEYKIIFCISDKEKDDLINKTEKTIKNIITLLKEKKYKQFTLYEGCLFKNKEGINQSYVNVKKLYNLKIVNKKKHLKTFDYITDIIINNENCTLEKDILIETWEKLLKKDKNNEYVKTLNVYYENNCEIAMTADILHIHRNTLNYRFERIFDITSLNPKSKKELYTLICSQSLYLNKN